jgi:hypothetical protein
MNRFENELFLCPASKISICGWRGGRSRPKTIQYPLQIKGYPYLAVDIGVLCCTAKVAAR